MNPEPLPWLLLQLADSAFPAGGFAHSGGLEAAAQQREVGGAGDVSAFLHGAIVQAGHGALPLVAAAHDDPGNLAALDALCDAFLGNPVANRASRTQGKAFLLACERAFPRPAVLALGAEVKSATLAPHYAPLFGAACRALGLDRRAAQAVFLHLACRGVLAAATRLGLVGSNEAQRLQSASAPHLEQTLTRCERLSLEDLAQTAPLLDLWQSTHDRLYSRLFQS